MNISECFVGQEVVSVHIPNPSTIYKITYVSPTAVDMVVVRSKKGSYNGNEHTDVDPRNLIPAPTQTEEDLEERQIYLNIQKPIRRYIMSYVEEAEEFREFLRKHGHNLRDNSATKTFVLDLNQGSMKIDASPARFHRFVEDMIAFFWGTPFSEINAIQQLVARKSDFFLMKDNIAWHRPYYVDYSSNKEDFITFKEYYEQFVK